MYAALLAVLALAGGPDPKTLELIKDAQATNLQRVRSGTLGFDVVQDVAGKRPARMKGTFTWRGGDGLWTYRLGDSDHLMTASEDSPVEVDEAPVQYALLVKDRFYAYRPQDNTLHLSAMAGREQGSTTFWMMDLFPQTLWTRCCPPFHGVGRSWTDMIGTGNPAARPGSTFDWAEVGPGTYRQTRTDADGGRGTMQLSLEFAGHVVANDYDTTNPRHEATRTRYEWQRVGEAVVLRSCEARRMFKGDPKRARVTYTARFDPVDVAAPVPASKFTFEEFAKLLPRDVTVVDNITNKNYPLDPSTVTIDSQLRGLGRKARAEGLSSGGKP